MRREIDIKQLSIAISMNDAAAIRQLYAMEKSPEATIQWEPSRTELEHEPLRRLHDYWHGLPKEARIPYTESFSLDDLPPQARRFCMVVEPRNQYMDVYYRYYGSGISERFGKDLTGHTTSAFEGTIATFFNAAYRAVSRKGVPLFTKHTPPPHVPVGEWHRLILPFGTESGEVSSALTHEKDCEAFLPLNSIGSSLQGLCRDRKQPD